MRQQMAYLRSDTLEGCDEEEAAVDGGAESKADRRRKVKTDTKQYIDGERD